MHNPQIKYLLTLQRRRHRTQAQAYLLEGVRLVEMALTANAPLQTVFYSPKLLANDRGRALYQAVTGQGIKTVQITDALMRQIAGTENPQGILAVATMLQVDYRQIPVSDTALFVVVDRVQDPGNLGTIIRTADGAGSTAVFLLPGTVDLYNLKTIRATMGSLFNLPVIEVADPAALFTWLQAQGVKVYLTALTGAQLYDILDYTGPTAFVVGNEANGIDRALQRYANATVKLPLPGKAESLNVAIATGILLYEALRQRHATYRDAKS